MKKKFSLAVLFLFVSILVIGVTPRTINAEVPSEKNSGTLKHSKRLSGVETMNIR